MTTWTQSYDFVLSKEEEEARGEASGSFPLNPIRSRMVEIRDNPPRLLNLLNPWEFTKVLTASDVGHLGGLVLGREHVQQHWALDWNAVNHGKQVPITIRDVDTRTEYSLHLRKWNTDDNFIIHNNWIRDFVIRRNLKEGDTIAMFWNRTSLEVCFSVLKRFGMN
ncbi:hypothetical protein ACHQM5_003391 [Ranunculus cassubicifolius]